MNTCDLILLIFIVFLYIQIFQSSKYSIKALSIQSLMSMLNKRKNIVNIVINLLFIDQNTYFLTILLSFRLLNFENIDIRFASSNRFDTTQRIMHLFIIFECPTRKIVLLLYSFLLQSYIFIHYSLFWVVHL